MDFQPIARPLRLLVVYKKSMLELYLEHETEAMHEMKDREPALYERFQSVHEDNEKAINSVREQIVSRGHQATFIHRAEALPDQDSDLILSVGGDGTLLDVSHYIKNQWVLGVNSAPDTSVGHYCATNCHGIGALLDRLQAGEIQPAPLNRLQITINGKIVEPPVLNDVLLAHVVPGAVSRYIISCNGNTEEHKSSGVWISTATGSTAAIQSAGGVRMDSMDKRVQYLVRELYAGPGKSYAIQKGFVEDGIEFLCKMRTGALFLDGHRERIALSLGDRVQIRPHPSPLNLLGFRHHTDTNSPSH